MAENSGLCTDVLVFPRAGRSEITSRKFHTGKLVHQATLCKILEKFYGYSRPVGFLNKSLKALKGCFVRLMQIFLGKGSAKSLRKMLVLHPPKNYCGFQRS